MRGTPGSSLFILATIGLMGLLAASVALVGGAPPGVQAPMAALGAGAFLLFALWATRHRHRVVLDGFAWLALAAAGFTLLQAAPLGLAVTGPLGGPTLDRAVHAIAATGVADPWWSLSADPPATAGEAVRLFLVALVLVLSSGLSGEPRRARAILAAVGLAGLATATLGAWSSLSGARDLLGLYASPTTQRGGFLTPLLNPNHASGLMNLSTFCWVSLALGPGSRRARMLAGAAATLSAAGSIATLSRAGGAILLALALSLPVALAALRPDRHRPRPRLALRVLRVAMLVSLGAVILLGFEELLVQLDQGSLMPGQWRTKAGPWGPVLVLVGDHPVAGIGRGAFATAFAAYNDFAPGFRFDFAENGVLQALADWGVVPGAAFVLAFALLLGRLALRCAGRAADLAAAFGVLAVAAQNLVDFSLQVPGVALPLAAVTGVLVRRTAPACVAPGRVRTGRSRAALVLLGAGMLAAIPLAWFAGHDDRTVAYSRLAAALSAPAGDGSGTSTDDALRREVRLHPVDAHLPWLAGRQALAAGDAPRAEPLLRLSLDLFPDSLPAGLALASIDAASGRVSGAIARYQSALDRHPNRRYEVYRALDVAPLDPEAVLAVFTGRDERLPEFLSTLHRDRHLDRLGGVLAARLAQVPDDPDRMEPLARNRLDLGRPEEAESLATRLLALYPDHPAGWYVQGQVYWAADHHIEALAMFREAEQRGGDADAGLWAARCLLLLDRYDEMDAQVARLWPRVAGDRYRTALVHQLLASRAGRTGNTARALEELDRADRAFPDIPSTALQRALLLRDDGRRTEAAREFQRALRLDPASMEALRGLDALRREGTMPHPP